MCVTLRERVWYNYITKAYVQRATCNLPFQLSACVPKFSGLTSSKEAQSKVYVTLLVELQGKTHPSWYAELIMRNVGVYVRKTCYSFGHVVGNSLLTWRRRSGSHSLFGSSPSLWLMAYAALLSPPLAPSSRCIRVLLRSSAGCHHTCCLSEKEERACFLSRAAPTWFDSETPPFVWRQRTEWVTASDPHSISKLLEFASHRMVTIFAPT